MKAKYAVAGLIGGAVVIISIPSVTAPRSGLERVVQEGPSHQNVQDSVFLEAYDEIVELQRKLGYGSSNSGPGKKELDDAVRRLAANYGIILPAEIKAKAEGGTVTVQYADNGRPNQILLRK